MQQVESLQIVVCEIKNNMHYENQMSRWKRDKQDRVIESVQLTLQWLVVIGLTIGLVVLFVNSI